MNAFINIILIFVFAIPLYAQDDNYSLSFDGVDDYIEIPNLIDGLDSLTIEAWFKYEDSDTWRWIYGGGTDWVDFGASIASGGNTIRYHFQTTESGWGAGDGSIQLSPYIWYHFSMTYDGVAFKGYIDGQFDFETMSSGSVATTTTQMIGAGFTNSSEYFKGNIDEVRIWDYELSQPEIQDHMYEEISGTESGLLSYWNLNEGTGNVAYDQSSYGNDGTIYGASWSTDIPMLGDVTAPATPTGLEATPGNMTVSLIWNGNTESDLGNYNVYREEISGFTPSSSNLIESVISTYSIVSWTDNSVNNGTTYYYRISALDTAGNESGFSDEVNATPNGPPIWIGIPDTSFHEDDSLFIDLDNYVFDDSDPDSILSLLVSGGIKITAFIDSLSHIVTFTTDPDSSGFSEEFIFTVVDPDGLEEVDTVTVGVVPVNDAPIIAAIADTSTAEEAPLTITVSSSDVDHGTHNPGDENIPTYSAISDTNAIIIQIDSVSSGHLTMTPVFDFHGDVTITVTVTDDGGLSDATDFILTVAPVNDAPIIEDIAAQVMNEDTTLTITVSSTDVDTGTGEGDENAPSYGAESSSPDDVEVSVADDQLTMEPALDFHGDITITVTVTDDGELSDTTDFILTVASVNDAPIIEDIAAQIMNEDTTLTIFLNASDVDGGSGEGDENDLVFSAVSDNDAISVSVDSTLLTITPDTNYYGNATITVTVTDMGNRLTDETSFGVTVNNVNDSPVLTVIGNQSTNEDTRITLSVDFTDVDIHEPDDTHTITVESSSSADVSVENLSGDVPGSTYDLVPSSDFFGIVDITVTVMENGEDSLAVSETYTLTVNAVNDAPVIEDIAAQVMNEDTTLTIILIASDVDGGSGEGDENDLAFSAVSDNDAISVSVDSTMLTIIPNTNYYGNVIITVTVTDMGNRLTDETSFGVTVN
ncbi:MAG: hypothetical protein CMF78_02185, partial [Candidatus Marinimicrobia bacterium]|nr:hypothetical protein [Candidatus Neomarinimicrobiota bacterium]